MHQFHHPSSHHSDPRECFKLLLSTTLNTPSEDYFISILQHLLSIREDIYARYMLFGLLSFVSSALDPSIYLSCVFLYFCSNICLTHKVLEVSNTNHGYHLDQITPLHLATTDPCITS